MFGVRLNVQQERQYYSREAPNKPDTITPVGGMFLRIPLPKGEGGAKHRVRGEEILLCTPHPPLPGTLSLRERDSSEGKVFYDGDKSWNQSGFGCADHLCFGAGPRQRSDGKEPIVTTIDPSKLTYDILVDGNLDRDGLGCPSMTVRC